MSPFGENFRVLRDGIRSTGAHVNGDRECREIVFIVDSVIHPDCRPVELLSNDPSPFCSSSRKGRKMLLKKRSPMGLIHQ